MRKDRGEMKHIGTQSIETERLILRRFTREDAGAMYRNWASDPEVTKYLTWPAHESEAVTARILDLWVGDYEKENTYQWAMELKELGEPVGSIGAVSFREDTQCAHIGYCMGSAWWGRGLMTEALAAVLEFFFGQVGVNRVESQHDVHNPASGAVMRKCGMRREGVLRQSERNNQGICDAVWYGMVASDRNMG